MTLALDHRVKVLLGALVMIALLAGGWFLGVQPALAAAFDATAQQSEVRTQNDALRAKLAALEAAQADLPELEKRLAALDASVPAGDAQSALLDSIDGLAVDAGVTVSRVAIEAALPYTAPGAPAGAAAGDAAPADPALVPHTDARITPENLVAVPVTVEVTGSLDAALGFLDGVQSGPRLFLVNKVSSVADSANGGSGDAVTATVSGYVYVLLAAAPAA